MNILAFDTGLNKTYLALSIDNKVFSATIESTDDKYHSAFLIKRIVELLNAHNLTTHDIDVFSTNIGPGSFTGIRVGLTVARGLAQGTQKDVIGINSLELISKAYGLPAVTVLDARKNKAYVGNNQEVQLADLENLKELLINFKGKIIADTRMQEFLKTQNIEAVNFEADVKDYGSILIDITKEKLNQMLQTKWQGLKPLYIQPPPIHQKN